MESEEGRDEKKTKVIDFRELPNDIILHITGKCYMFEVSFMENEKPNLVKTFYGKLGSKSFLEDISKTTSVYLIFGVFQIYDPNQFTLLPRKTKGVVFYRNSVQIPRNRIRNLFPCLEYIGKFSIVDEGEENLFEEVDSSRFERLEIRILSFDDSLLRSINQLRALRVFDLEVKSMPISDPTVDLTLPKLRKLSITKISMYKKNFNILSNSITFKGTPNLRHIEIRCSNISENQITNLCNLQSLVEIRLVGSELGENYFLLFQNPTLRVIVVDSCRFNKENLSKVELKNNGKCLLNKVCFLRIQEGMNTNSPFPVEFVGELMKKATFLVDMEFNDFRLKSEFLEFVLENYEDGRRFTLNVLNNPDISIDVCNLVKRKKNVGLKLIHS